MVANNAGTLALVGSNSFTGLVWTGNAPAVLQIGNGTVDSNFTSTSQLFEINTNPAGTVGLVVQPAVSSSIAGQITGSGGVLVNGPGTLVLSNSLNNYSGGTTVLQGTLQLAVANTNSQTIGLAGGTLSFAGGIPLNGLERAYTFSNSNSYYQDTSPSGVTATPSGTSAASIASITAIATGGPLPGTGYLSLPWTGCYIIPGTSSATYATLPSTG